MKRCPECRRDYLDDSLMFCLEDGVALIQGSVSLPDEPPTAILGNADRFPGATTILHALKTKPEPDAGQDRAPRKPSFFTSTATKVPTILVVLIVILYAAFSGYRYLSAPKQIGSIAVMPFVNESGNADVEYLSDGLTETLIGSLSKLGDLSVKSRSAVFAYKGRDISAKDIGSALGVQAVLIGRLVQRGENIKLNLELVNATTQDVIWADQYDRKQADLVNLQSEIARDVSSKLKSKLSGSDQRTLDKKYTDDPEAYRLYLQGRFYLNKRVGKEYEKAEGYLRQAVGCI